MKKMISLYSISIFIYSVLEYIDLVFLGDFEFSKNLLILLLFFMIQHHLVLFWFDFKVEGLFVPSRKIIMVAKTIFALIWLNGMISIGIFFTNRLGVYALAMSGLMFLSAMVFYTCAFGRKGGGFKAFSFFKHQ